MRQIQSAEDRRWAFKGGRTVERQDGEYRFARLILRLANRIIRNRDRHVRALGLTTEQADSLLFFLGREGASITCLKEYLGVTHQTARGIVQRLKEKGLIETAPSPADGRRQLVRPTQGGVEMGARLRQNGSRTGSQLLAGMSREERELFRRLLQTAWDNIEEEEP